MSTTAQTVWTCDRKACPGDGANTPASTTVAQGPRPDGWIHLDGGVECGNAGASVAASKDFHNLACFEAWMTEEFLPDVVVLAGQGAKDAKAKK